MKWKPIIFATLGVIFVTLGVITMVQLCSGPVYRLFHPHTQQDVITNVFKNQKIYSVIQSPQSVTAQRLHPKYDGSGTLDRHTNDAPSGHSPQQIQAIQLATMDGHTNDAPVDLSPQEIQDLQNLSNSGILLGYTKDAPVRLSPKQIQAIQKLLEKPTSYHWNMHNNCIPDYGVLLNFRLQGDTVHVALCFKCDNIGVFEGDDDTAQQINQEYMIDLIHPQLVAICKEIFPNDKEIQGLK